MYMVSNAWVKAHSGFLAPEGFVELSCYIPDLQETLVYTKSDLISFTHHQTGDLMSGELPKNSIEFTLDNSDGRWNPSNPKGLERYLSERLRIKLRYGFKINGTVSWIPGGVFYLSEWRTSLNGVTASFVARDLLEYVMDRPYTGSISGTLYDIAERAVAEADIPTEGTLGRFVLGESTLGGYALGVDKVGTFNLCDELKLYTVEDIEYNGEDSIAVILQKCANAAGCVMYQNRCGVFNIKRLDYLNTGYVIPTNLSYSYPEIEFLRPIKNVSVTYQNGNKLLYSFSGSGETQTLNNDFISTEAQATEVAQRVCDSIRSRRNVTGEFRGDTRLDLYDVVNVESKYGTITGVVLTDVTYTFSGAFRTSYSGYIRGSGVAVTMHCGEVYSGEVV